MCTLVTTVAWQMAMECLEKKVPHSNSHEDNYGPAWRGPEGVSESSLPGVGLLTTGDLCTGLGPLPPSLLLSSLTSTLTEAAFVGSPRTHTHVTLWAEDLQKPLGGRF